jgi:alcohol dehydrogenase YqhD (iron-dependent ADH family)
LPELFVPPWPPPQESHRAKKDSIMKLLLSLTAAATLLVAVPTWASCTPEEAEQKAQQLAAKVQQLTEQNPQKAKEINDELQAMNLKTESKDRASHCDLYDKRIKELETAKDKSEN